MQTEAIKSLVSNFVAKLDDVITERAHEMAKEAVEAALGGNGKSAASVKKPRKKGPIQLCPVPKCTNRAAPSLGMVCIEHKTVPKAQIKKYREARRAAKAKN